MKIDVEIEQAERERESENLLATFFRQKDLCFLFRFFLHFISLAKQMNNKIV